MIFFLSTRYSIGGAQMNAVMMAEAFKARGHDAEAWFLTRTGDMAETDVPVRIFLQGPPRPWSWPLVAGRFLWAVATLRPAGGFGFHPLSCILGGLSRLVGLRRFVATQNNPPGSQTPLLGEIEKLLGATRLYTGNIAVSQAVKNDYAAYPKAYLDKLTVVHNGVPAPPAVSRAEARVHWGLEDSAFVIGNVGRLAEQKNPEFLIEVLARAPDAHLLLAGEGPLEASLRRRAQALGVEDRLHLVGRVDGVEVARAYAALDLFVLPSHFEGFGRTIIEAFHMGVPVLANDLPVTREVGEDSALYNSLDAGAWAERITALAGQPAELARLSALSRRRAAAFTVEAMAEGYARVLDVPPTHKGSQGS